MGEISYICNVISYGTSYGTNYVKGKYTKNEMNMDKERKEITAAAAQTVPEAVTGAQPQQPVNFRSEKIYTVYQTKDGRMQLKVCYATSTAWLLKEGELVSTERDVTLAGVGGMVAALEDYDQGCGELPKETTFEV